MERGGIEATPVQRRGGHECCLSDVVCLSKTVCLSVQDCLSKIVCLSAPQALPSLSASSLLQLFVSLSAHVAHSTRLRYRQPWQSDAVWSMCVHA